MVKVYVYRDDFYRYGISIGRTQTEVPDELVEKYFTLEKEMEAVQKELAKYSEE